MSYNGSGTFNINTSGQPVVDGTTITATAFNTLTADLGVGLTTAICKDGQSTATARINFAAGAGVSNGTVSVPALNFINDTGCGLYRIGSGNLGLAISGTKVLDITATSVTFSTSPVTTAFNVIGGLSIHAGGRPAPSATDINSFSIDFDSSGNAGVRIWSFGPDTSTYAPVSFRQYFSDGTGAENRFYIGATGFIGIGTESPTYTFTMDVDNISANNQGMTINTHEAGSSQIGAVWRSFTTHGTAASPTKVLADDPLGIFAASGFWTGKPESHFVPTNSRAEMRIAAAEDWNDSTHNGTYINWGTTAVATNTQVVHMTLTSTGILAIGTVSPSDSAALQIDSTVGAVLIPRMTSTQRDALTPVNGMILYNSTTDKFQGYQAGSWQNLI